MCAVGRLVGIELVSIVGVVVIVVVRVVLSLLVGPAPVADGGGVGGGTCNDDDSRLSLFAFKMEFNIPFHRSIDTGVRRGETTPIEEEEDEIEEEVESGEIDETTPPLLLAASSPKGKAGRAARGDASGRGDGERTFDSAADIDKE